MTDEPLHEPVLPNNSDDEQLTALIDGELSDAEKTEIEKRLETDPALRARYEKLRAVDDYLSRLERPAVGPEMATRTMELVTGVVQKEIRAAQKRARRGQILFLLALAVISAAALFIADRLFQGRFSASADDRDYPVFSRLDALEAVETLPFLKALSELPYFGKGEPFMPPVGTPPGGQSVPPYGPPHEGAPRAGYGPFSSPLAELNNDELFLKKIRYNNLPRKERKRYRDLYSTVMAEPDAELLDRTLIRFGNWFRNRLTETERNRFRAEPEESRLAMVETLLRESSNRRFSRHGGGRPERFSDSRSPRDPQKWFDEMRLSLPEELRNEKLGVQDELRDFSQRRIEERKAAGEGPDWSGRHILDEYIVSKGVSYFTDRLSGRAKEYIESRPEEEQIRLISRLIRIEFYTRVAGRGPAPFFGGHGRHAPSAGDESTADLAETLQKLPEDVREELFSLPDDEMYEILLEIHRMRGMRNGPSPRRPLPPPPKRAGQED